METNHTTATIQNSSNAQVRTRFTLVAVGIVAAIISSLTWIYEVPSSNGKVTWIDQSIITTPTVSTSRSMDVVKMTLTSAASVVTGNQ